MVRIADIAAHGQSKQLAAEMILKSRTKNLLAVVKILGADKPDDGVDEHRIEMTRKAIRPGLACLLTDVRMSIGRKSAPLAGFEVHHVLPDCPALKFGCCLVRLCEQRKIDAEGSVGTFSTGYGLEHKVNGRALLKRRKLCSDMG